MKICKTRKTKLHPESGMTLIELAIAGVVLVFGMLSLMGVMITAVGNNGRSKIDSSATMLNQAVLEQISAKLAGGGPGSITYNLNCNGTGTTHQIADDVGGASLNGSTINFNQPQGAIAPSGTGALFYMSYVDCNNNVKTTYDVRWNIQLLNGSTYVVTVGAKPMNNLPTRFSFSIPVNMRAYVGGN